MKKIHLIANPDQPLDAPKACFYENPAALDYTVLDLNRYLMKKALREDYRRIKERIDNG